MDVQEELDRVLCWIAALLILLLQWLYPRVPWSHVLSRMFYDHLTLSHDLTLLSPHPIYILTPLYALCYQGTVNVLSGHPRWIFRKNSMEFFVGLQPYLYYYYSGCTLESYGHMSLPECSMVTWPCHVTWLTKFLSCLCLYSVVCLEFLVWVFRCMGNLFLLKVLTTWPPLQVSSSWGIFPSVPIFVPFLFPLSFVSSFPPTI